MDNHKQNKYSTEELREFEQLIMDKLNKALQELSFIQEALIKGRGNSVEMNVKLFEEIPDTVEKETLSILINRQSKYILNLENALMRIKNGTYGICTVTGELIDKERLRVVPHSRHSFSAKYERESQQKMHN